MLCNDGCLATLLLSRRWKKNRLNSCTFQRKWMSTTILGKQQCLTSFLQITDVASACTLTTDSSHIISHSSFMVKCYAPHLGMLVKTLSLFHHLQQFCFFFPSDWPNHLSTLSLFFTMAPLYNSHPRMSLEKLNRECDLQKEIKWWSCMCNSCVGLVGMDSCCAQWDQTRSRMDPKIKSRTVSALSDTWKYYYYY